MKYATSVLVLLLLVFASPVVAFADCDDEAPESAIILMDGLAGYDNGDDNIAICIHTDVTVTGNDQEAINTIGDGVTLQNYGTIISGDDRAVDIKGTNSIVINEGTINKGSGTGATGDGIRVGEGAHINNSGTIFSDTAQAIDCEDDDAWQSGITIISSGVIHTNGGSTNDGKRAIRAVANLKITNSGTISSTFGEGIEADGDGFVLVNTGEITAFQDDQVNARTGATITNQGRMVAEANDVIDLVDGLVFNKGEIISKSANSEDAAIDFDASRVSSKVLNEGLIYGPVGIDTDVNNVTDQASNNYGEIVGVAGIAMQLRRGDDHVFIGAGGSVEGLVDGGTGFDKIVASNRSEGELHITNFDKITIESGGPNRTIVTGPLDYFIYGPTRRFGNIIIHYSNLFRVGPPFVESVSPRL